TRSCGRSARLCASPPELRILLTGRDGQVGWELAHLLPALGEVRSTGRAELDLADADAIRRLVRDWKPALIINAAAYTAVDKAESEPELAMRVNGAAPGVVADQRGVPTTSGFLAEKTVELLRRDASGLLHLVPMGETTWYGFAREIVQLARAPAEVEPITSAEFPTAARRPANSVLDNAR